MMSICAILQPSMPAIGWMSVYDLETRASTAWPADATMDAQIKHAAMVKTVEQLLFEARSLLPHRFTPEETLREIGLGTLVIDIRGDEQQRRDGLIPGALIIRRNVLEWRCDPTSPWHHPEIKHHGQKIILVCDEGYQSSLAAANLQQLGLKQATDMADGFSGWRSSGLPVAPYGTSFWLTLRGKIRRWLLPQFRRFH